MVMVMVIIRLRYDRGTTEKDNHNEDDNNGDANDPNINRTIFISEHPSVEFQAGCCYFSSQADIGPTVLNFLGITSTKFDEETDGFSVILN